MFKKIVPFNIQTLRGKKIKPVNTFGFAANSHIFALLGSEFKQAALSYPIVFLKEGEDFNVFALVGLKQNENLFVDSDGQWQKSYIPAVVRRYPFVLGKSQEGSDQFLVCIDEESEFLSDTEGEPLVVDDKPAQIVDKAKEFLSEIYRFSGMTRAFCKELAERELLSPLNMQLKDNASGVTQNVTGCYVINEKNLNALSDEDFLSFRKRGFLPLIYAHLFSLAQTEKLARLQAERNKK